MTITRLRQTPRNLVVALVAAVTVLFAAQAVADPVTRYYCINCALPRNTSVTDGTHNWTLLNQIHAYAQTRFGIYETHGGYRYYWYERSSPGYVDINHPAFYSQAHCYNGSNQANIVVDFCLYSKKGGS